MRKTVTTICILTPLPWKNVVTGLRCSVTTIYRIICYGILGQKYVILVTTFCRVKVLCH